MQLLHAISAGGSKNAQKQTKNRLKRDYKNPPTRVREDMSELWPFSKAGKSIQKYFFSARVPILKRIFLLVECEVV